MLPSRGSSSFHATSSGSIKSLRQEKLKGEVLKTSVTIVCLCRAIWYKKGYWSRREDVPNQISSQNLIWEPFFIVKVPNHRKSCFTFIRPTQKWEPPDFQ
jgi:hypothetical protein